MWNDLTPKVKRIVIAVAVAVLFAIGAKFGVDIGGQVDGALDAVDRVDSLLSDAVTEPAK